MRRKKHAQEYLAGARANVARVASYYQTRLGMPKDREGAEEWLQERLACLERCMVHAALSHLRILHDADCLLDDAYFVESHAFRVVVLSTISDVEEMKASGTQYNGEDIRRIFFRHLKKYVNATDVLVQVRRYERAGDREAAYDLIIEWCMENTRIFSRTHAALKSEWENAEEGKLAEISYEVALSQPDELARSAKVESFVKFASLPQRARQTLSRLRDQSESRRRFEMQPKLLLADSGGAEEEFGSALSSKYDPYIQTAAKTEARRFIARLTEIERRTVELDAEGYSDEEIAERLGESKEATKKRFQRIRRDARKVA